MKVLVIGNGGREHAIAWKISNSKRVKKIFFTGRNAGLEEIAEPVDIKMDEKFKEVVDFSTREKIDLVVVGPELPLAGGIVDILEQKKIPVFGPNKKAARLESSKDFAKKIMMEAGVPTGESKSFKDFDKAKKYLEKIEGPYVIKADGLAAGKGVIISENIDEAVKAVKTILVDKAFGDSGSTVLIEEYLSGEECSMLAFTDGETYIPMVSAQDHKRVFDGDKGPNTGGMGSYSPCPLVTKHASQVINEKVFTPMIKVLKKNGIKYKGVLYAGIMMCGGEPKILEFNCRFGDPETQSVLPLLKNDIVDLFEDVIQERLSETKLRWRKGASVCVVMSSGGYPGDYKKGIPINGLDKLKNIEDVYVFHAGTAKKDNQIVTSGGRVLGVTAVAPTLPEALHESYKYVSKIQFDGMHFRSDVGRKGLNFRR